MDLEIATNLADDCSNERSRRVLQAAATVFLERGFSAATTDMIQREAGVSKATLYECYANKEALFIAAIKAKCAASTQSVRNIQFQPGDLRKTLTELGRAYLEIVLSSSDLALFRVVIAEAPRFPQLARIFYLAGPRVIAAMLSEILIEAQQVGEVDVSAVGVDGAASMFSGLVCHEAQVQCLTHPDTPPSAAQIDQWVDLAVTTFLCAFGRMRKGSSALG